MCQVLATVFFQPYLENSTSLISSQHFKMKVIIYHVCLKPPQPLNKIWQTAKEDRLAACRNSITHNMT